jgi:hypothetical protein
MTKDFAGPAGTLAASASSPLMALLSAGSPQFVLDATTLTIFQEGSSLLISSRRYWPVLAKSKSSPRSLFVARAAVNPKPSQIPVVNTLPPVPDFPTYLRRLPHWERYLIEHVSSAFACTDILDFLSEYVGVGVSDGSSAPHLVLFGWALALATPTEGQRLATCLGIVYGNDPSSFRSEAAGLLAMLLFLAHLGHFFDVTSDCSVNLYYTDNKGLVVDVLPQMTKPFQSSLASFRANWDLLQAITSTTIKRIGSTPLHVHHEVSTLSLPAQLNVEADGLATDFNAPLTIPLPEIPFDPMTKIQLVVGHKTVTSHFRS